MKNTHDILLATRTALSDLVEQTPMAPEWHDLEIGLQRLTPQPPPRRWRSLVVAVAAAVVAFVAIGAVTIFGSSRDLGDTASSSTTPPATTQPPATPTTMLIVPPERVNLVDQIASAAASSQHPGFPATNLIDGSTDTPWNDAGVRGEGAALTFEFPDTVYLDTIVITNLQDDTELLRNYRIKDIEIEFQTSDGPVFMSTTAPGTSDPQIIDAGIVHQGSLVIRVLNVWPAEDVDDSPASHELAVAEVDFYGSTMPTGNRQATELEAVLRETERLIAALDSEIDNLDGALATAEGDAARELQDRLAASKAAHEDLMRQAERLQDELDARTDDLDP